MCMWRPGPRHYTSNLVKLGFTDEERRITEAGAAFARGATRRDELEAMLPIDDVNLIVLRQMLKLRIFSAPDEAGRRRFYAPRGDGAAVAAAKPGDGRRGPFSPSSRG